MNRSTLDLTLNVYRAAPDSPLDRRRASTAPVSLGSGHGLQGRIAIDTERVRVKMSPLAPSRQAVAALPETGRSPQPAPGRTTAREVHDLARSAAADRSVLSRALRSDRAEAPRHLQEQVRASDIVTSPGRFSLRTGDLSHAKASRAITQAVLALARDEPDRGKLAFAVDLAPSNGRTTRQALNVARVVLEELRSANALDVDLEVRCDSSLGAGERTGLLELAGQSHARSLGWTGGRIGDDDLESLARSGITRLSLDGVTPGFASISLSALDGSNVSALRIRNMDARKIGRIATSKLASFGFENGVADLSGLNEDHLLRQLSGASRLRELSLAGCKFSERTKLLSRLPGDLASARVDGRLEKLDLSRTFDLPFGELEGLLQSRLPPKVVDLAGCTLSAAPDDRVARLVALAGAHGVRLEGVTTDQTPFA